jgi:hypothetical protein
VPAVVRRFEEHRLPELVVAAVAGDQDVSHAAVAAGSFAGRFAQARFPAHLRLAGPQLVTERGALGLVLEHRDGHLNDQALTSGDTSMIISTSMRRHGIGPCASLPRFGAEGKRVNLPGATWLRGPFHSSLIGPPAC